MEFIKKFNKFMYSDLYSPFEVLMFIFISSFKLGFVITFILIVGVIFINRIIHDRVVDRN